MRAFVFFAFGILTACATATAVIPDDDSGTPQDGGGTCTMCGNACADVKTDPQNCGKCGNVCPANATCVQGSCQCPSGQTRCTNTCVDTKTDNTNCGKCGTVCGVDAGAILGGGSWSCVAATCTIVCPQPKQNCSNACVDVQTDNDNCGMCTNACAPMTEQCMQGQCCKTGQQICGGMCTSTQSDPMNCGMCNKPCPMNAPVCANGMCTQYQVLGTLGNVTFYKVPVSGAMSDVNTGNACKNSGLKIPCTAAGVCMYNASMCLMTMENQCYNPMIVLSQKICNSSPSTCAALNGVYQNMGGAWVSGSSCGVENGTWCSQGNNYMNRWALCAQ